MKHFFSVLLTAILSMCIFPQTYAQVSVSGNTNTTPNLSSSYTSLASAVTALNGVTSISGSVVFTLANGYKEIAPSGGYAINFTATTTFSDTIIFDGGPTYDTIVANSGLTAGALNDAIFKIIGCDFVTIKRFTMIENSANTTINAGTNNMTEWGVALLRSSSTNGAQYNTIIDNVISLNRTYPNSFGIYSNVRHTATVVGTASDITSISGSNHDNKIYLNQIKNVSMGITFIGSSTDARMDENNDVGGSSSLTGNALTEWGGNSMTTATFTGNIASEYYGILMRCEKNCNVSWNSIVGSTSMSGAVAAPIRGIHIGSTTGTLTGTFTTTVDYNTVTITDNLPTGSSSLSRVDGIFCGDKLGSGTLSISNNLINGIAVTGSGSGRQIRGISNTASVDALFINSNIIKGNTSTATASVGGWFFAIDQLGTITSNAEVNYNLIGDYSSTTPAITYTSTASGGAFVRGINYNPASNPTGTSFVSISGNSMYGFVQSSTSSNHHTYILCDHTTTINSIIQVDGNHFENISANTTGDVNFINSPGAMTTGAGAQLLITNNDIVGSFTKGAGGDVYIYNASGSSSTGNTMIESGNNFSNITLSGSAIMHGWYNVEGATAAGPEKFIKGNIFQNWVCSTSGTGTANVIYCDWASGNSEISGNVLSSITANGSLSGIADASSTPTTMTYNGNQISGLSCNSVLSGIDIRGGGNVARTLINSAIVFLTNTILNPTYLFAVQYSSIGGAGTSTLDCYYNTIYLSVTTTAPVFTSTCLAISGSSSSGSGTPVPRVRNNIFINNSVPTTTGKSSIIYNQGMGGQIANYSVSSNNNTFWLGTRLTAMSPISTAISDAAHVIYNDPLATDKLTLANFQAFVPGGTIAPPVGTESLSVLVMPEFINAIPPVLMTDPAIDLHLLSDCGTTGVNDKYIFNRGNNQGILALTDWPVLPPGGSNWPVLNSGDGDPRLTVSPFVTDIGADQHIRTYTWTGVAGTAWNNNSNWTPSQYPNNSEANVYIPKAAGTRPQPIIAPGESWQVGNVFFQTGLSSSVLPLLTNRGTLKVAGGKPLQTRTGPIEVPAIRGDAGSFSNYSAAGVVVGSIEMNSACRIPAQTLGGLVFVNKKVFDLRIRNNVSISSATNDGVKVVGELNFGSLTGLNLNTGASVADNTKNLTMVSTVDRTANVASLVGNTVTGDVTVERYIHVGTAAASGSIPAQHLKSWQLLSTPTSGQSVRQSWMEGMLSGNDDRFPGYGTNVPGLAGTGAGFDQTSISGDGIKWWDHTANPGIYVPLPNTSVSLNNPRGYFLFVRGDRSVINFTGMFSAPVPTTLRQKGSLFQPTNPPAQTTFPSDINNPTIFISVGNPYASAINLNAMVSGGGFNNISASVYIYDPALGSLGGYQLLNRATGYASVNATNTQYYTQGVQYPNIESGNAFYVSPATAASGSITFTESVKTSSQRLVNRSSIYDDSVKMNATLYLPGNKVADGNVVFFGSGYSNMVDSNDVLKLQNPGENFFINQDTAKYIVARRDLIGISDSIFYSFNNLSPETYTLKFGPSYLSEVGLSATLIDNYADTTFDISLEEETEVSFVVDSTLGSMEGRFTLVFSRSVSSKVPVASAESFQKVFPNPVTNGIFFVEPDIELSGNCRIQVVNSSGQTIVKQMISHVENMKSIKVDFGRKIPAGIYHVLISDEKGKKMTRHIIVK